MAKTGDMRAHNPVQYGTVLKEYAEVPDTLLEQTQELRPFFEISYKYVRSLKPKPSKKKAAARSR